MTRRITDEERFLTFKVMDSFPAPREFSVYLGYLHEHFPAAMFPEALKWLIQNNLVGPRFFEWVEEACQGSVLRVHQTLLSKVLKREKRPVIYNKDFFN